jgi:hypothetical protein
MTIEALNHLICKWFTISKKGRGGVVEEVSDLIKILTMI